MRRWIGFTCGAAALCAVAWYFGRPTAVPEAPVPVAVQAPPTEAPKALPPKMIEVIDLARAYEPVREPEPILVGGVDPASFIEERDAPARIPPAFNDENPYADVIRTLKEGRRERIELMPRLVPDDGPLHNLLHVPEFPYPIRLDAEPPEAKTLLMQIVELYSYVGFGPVWLGDALDAIREVK